MRAFWEEPSKNARRESGAANSDARKIGRRSQGLPLFLKVKINSRFSRFSPVSSLFAASRGSVLLSLLYLIVIFIFVTSFNACSSLRTTAPNPYLAFVANNQSNSLAAVDLARLRTVASIPVAPSPQKVTIRPGRQELYVTGGAGGISIVAFPELRVVATLQIGGNLRDLAFSADGHTAYVLEASKGEIVVLDCDQRKETARLRLGSAASSLALTPDGKTLVIAHPGQNRLAFIRAESRKPLGSVEVGRKPGPMVILPDSSKVFVADTEEGKISEADIASLRILAHLEIGAKPSTLALKPDGGEIFVFSASGSGLTIVDAFHANIEASIPTGREPSAAVFRRDSSVLYFATAQDGLVTTFDVQNQTVLSSTHVGTEPRALALSPDERFVVVADSASASLAILRADLRAKPLTLLTTIPVGARPVDVVVPDWRWDRD